MVWAVYQDDVTPAAIWSTNISLKFTLRTDLIKCAFELIPDKCTLPHTPIRVKYSVHQIQDPIEAF